MNKIFNIIEHRLLLILLLASISSCLTTPHEKNKEDKTDLGSWTSHLRSELIKHIKYAPKENRVMVFDLDGTLISEVPHYYILQLMSTFVDTSGLENESDLVRILKEFTERADYEKLCEEYVKKTPPKIYKPMMELIAYGVKENYEIIICTGTEIMLAREITKKYFPMVTKVIGTNLNIRVNDKEGKVDYLKEESIRPMFAFGNSEGDFAMMKYATEKSYLIIKNDKKSKEFDAPQTYIEACKQNGFGYCKINGDWLSLFHSP